MPQNTTRIQSITLRLCKVELQRTNYFSSGGTEPDIKAIIVEMHSDAYTGWGEWIPTSIIYAPGHIGRSSIEEWDMSQTIAARLIGTDARNTQTWMTEDLESEDANGLIDGFDFAMHDLIAKSIGWSVQKLLGNGAEWVWGLPLIYRNSPEVSLERAKELYAEGAYQWIKLKPSCDPDQDEATMRLIREQVCKSIQFFIDPNYSLPNDIDFVVKYLNRLYAHGLRVCEDPIQTELEVYKAIQQQTPVEIMLDEKARSLSNVRTIAASGCTKRINIHANWAGGFVRGLERIRLAAHFGLESIIGGTRYLGIGTAAYQTMAALIPHTSLRLCEQINDTLHVKESVVKNRYRTQDGKIYISKEPGLGIEVDREKLDALTIKKVTID